MAQHPFLKSIRPVNLLSFGPDTEEIELRPLNILIGPNGCGKSNLIEVVGLLNKLPEKDPWYPVIGSGGAGEWIWKGKNTQEIPTSLSVKATGQPYPIKPFSGSGVAERLYSPDWAEKPLSYSITLRAREGTFDVVSERFEELDRWENDAIHAPWFERDGWTGHVHSAAISLDSPERFPSLPPNRSVLSMPQRCGQY